MWRDIIKSGGILFSGVAISRCLMFLYRYICMRTLSTADYGKLALIISLFVSLLTFAHFNMGTALSKFFSETRQRNPEDNLVLLLNTLVLALVTSSFSSLIMIWFLKDIGLLSPMMGLLCVFGFFLLSIAIISGGALRGFFKMKLSASIDVLSGGARFIFILLITILGYKSLKEATMVYFGATVVPFGFSVLMVKSMLYCENKNKLSKLINFEIMKKIINFSKYLTFASLSLYIMWFFSRWILTSISYKSVAIYDGAMLIYSILQMGFAAIVVALVPYISKQASIGKEKLEFPPAKKIIFPYLIVLVILFGIKVLSVDQRFLIAIGLKKYVSCLPLFYIMFLAAPVDLLFGISSGILQGLGKTKELFNVVLSVFPIHIIGTYLFARYKGEYGVAIMFIFTYVILARLGYIKVMNV